MTQEVFDKAIDLQQRINSFKKAHNAIIDAGNLFLRRSDSKSISEGDIVNFVYTLVEETGGELEVLTIVKCAADTIDAKCKQLEEEFTEL